MFVYKDRADMTREELLDEIIAERVKGSKTWTLEKQLRLKDEVPENKAKDYYSQLNAYIAEQVAGKLEKL